MTTPSPSEGLEPTVSFDALCRREKATYAERDDLAWQLAMMRARELYAALRPQPRYPLRGIPA